jgi:hypothetical protein
VLALLQSLSPAEWERGGIHLFWDADPGRMCRPARRPR